MPAFNVQSVCSYIYSLWILRLLGIEFLVEFFAKSSGNHGLFLVE